LYNEGRAEKVGRYSSSVETNQKGVIVMGNAGKKDKGNKEQRKKPKLSIKEKRKQKNEKKNK
jgi:hypothetical protein